MSAPGLTARQTPSGKKLKDGHPSYVTFKRNPSICFFENSTTPPGIDGGDAIETHTFHNDEWRTLAPRALKTMTEMEMSGLYDPVLYTDILALVNILDEITVWFSDGSAVAFWGFLRMFEPDEMTEGEPPTATITITPTNEDPDGNEEPPVVTEVAGT